MAIIDSSEPAEGGLVEHGGSDSSLLSGEDSLGASGRTGRVSRGRRLVRYCCGGQDCSPWHVLTFLLTFFSYALFHASRKTVSNTKKSFIRVWVNNQSLTHHNDEWLGLSEMFYSFDNHDISGEAADQHYMFSSEKQAEEFLGILDSLFLGAYAIGLYISGMLGDRFEPRFVLSIGMCSSAVCVLLFGAVSEWLHIYSAPFYAIVWTLCGLLQSMGWPTEVAVMGNWFGRGSRGAVLGLWSACASVGNIMGTLLSAWMLPLGYQYAFLANAVALFVGGLIILATLKATPSDVGLPDPVEDTSPNVHHTPVTTHHDRLRPISFWRALLLPGVLAYSLCYACVKLVNYSFFFWLPYFLSTENHWSQADADEISTFYDWGGIVAGFLAGILTDHLPSRTPVVAGMLFVSSGTIFAYQHYAVGDKTRNIILLTLMGFFIGGPSNLISSAVSADLGRQPAIMGSAEGLATVAGIVDGTGSVGASLGQLLMPLLMKTVNGTSGETVKHNDTLIYDLFILVSMISVLCLIPLMLRDGLAALRRRGQVQYSAVGAAECASSDTSDDQQNLIS